VRPAIRKKKKYCTGIRASQPNQVWHADITIVKTKDNIKHYVYLLMDNFSKFILSWRIEPFVSGKIRVETIKEAYNKYLKSDREITLITDCGPENVNSSMFYSINNETDRLNPIIALKDVPYSNSVMEAQDKLFKYRYLFRQVYNNIDDLRIVFGLGVFDYNNIRPHISLKGYTPYEAFSGVTELEAVWKEQVQSAQKSRLVINKRELCEVCR
jgi:putative transposase